MALIGNFPECLSVISNFLQFLSILISLVSNRIISEPETTILQSSAVVGFRKEVRDQLTPLLLGLLPSLAETDKPYPPDDWSRE